MEIAGCDVGDKRDPLGGYANQHRLRQSLDLVDRFYRGHFSPFPLAAIIGNWTSFTSSLPHFLPHLMCSVPHVNTIKDGLKPTQIPRTSSVFFLPPLIHLSQVSPIRIRSCLLSNQGGKSVRTP
jgi:hypothetical protein